MPNPKKKDRKKAEIIKKDFSLTLSATLTVFFSLLVSILFCILLVWIFDALHFELRPFNSLLLFTLLLLGISGVIVVIVFHLVFHRFTAANEQIKYVLNEIAKGNFDVQISSTKSKYINNTIDDINTVLNELKSVKIMRSDFISDFSHEFKTPIVNINGFAELLLSENLTDEERKEYARIIYDESNRLSKISQNVLLLNKLNAQSITPDKESYALDEQIRRCITQFMREIEKKELQIELNSPPITFYGDENLLKQVWINLLGNAIKFSPRGGHISVEGKTDNDYVSITVSDEGCGMDEETQKHIFDQFFQADKSHKTEGNGLGLSIVQRIVQLYNGEVSVRSAPDMGTSFTVKLPR